MCEQKELPNLDKSNIWLSDPAPFNENYAKLYFHLNYLKASLNRDW